MHALKAGKALIPVPQILEPAEAATSSVCHFLSQGVLVKLYEINCWNYYTIERKAVDLNLELSGLTPTKTINISSPEDPIIRSASRLKLIDFAHCRCLMPEVVWNTSCSQGNRLLLFMSDVRVRITLLSQKQSSLLLSATA